MTDEVSSNNVQPENDCSSENIQMQFLQNKTSNLELQLGQLSSKFEFFIIGFMTSSKASNGANEPKSNVQQKYLF